MRNTLEDIRRALQTSKDKYLEYVENLKKEHGSKYKEELRRKEADEQQRRAEQSHK